MAMVEINWSPSRKELRQFGFLCLFFFGGLAAWHGYKKGVTTGVEVLAVLAAVGGVLGAAAPQLLKWIYVGWMVAVYPIGWTVSHLLLGFIYYAVLTPIGVLIRALGHDPMNRKLDRSATTYWTTHEQAPVARYFRQF
ncbi:MAG TPA: SxtJ family membrane protein [Candidatus Limnocylindrales bacterium]|nr:SxtJ family membrane protein [Candidatus Limnocylindrales bacterium]